MVTCHQSCVHRVNSSKLSSHKFECVFVLSPTLESIACDQLTVHSQPTADMFYSDQSSSSILTLANHRRVSYGSDQSDASLVLWTHPWEWWSLKYRWEDSQVLLCCVRHDTAFYTRMRPELYDKVQVWTIQYLIIPYFCLKYAVTIHKLCAPALWLDLLWMVRTFEAKSRSSLLTCLEINLKILCVLLELVAKKLLISSDSENWMIISFH